MFALTPPAVVWMIIALISAILEILLPSFSFIFVTVAALVSSGLAALGFGFTVQIVTFSVLLIASRSLIRPRVVAKLGSKGVPSRTEALVGKEAHVTQEINPTIGTGRVNVGGEDWAASSDRTVPSGTSVRVIGADGIVLRVVPAHEPRA